MVDRSRTRAAPPRRVHSPPSPSRPSRRKPPRTSAISTGASARNSSGPMGFLTPRAWTPVILAQQTRRIALTNFSRWPSGHFCSLGSTKRNRTNNDGSDGRHHWDACYRDARQGFWDNARDVSWSPSNGTSVSSAGAVIASASGTGLDGTFIGGAALAAHPGGVCTDCHAGENAFVVHPFTALDLGPKLFSLATGMIPSCQVPGSRTPALGRPWIWYPSERRTRRASRATRQVETAADFRSLRRRFQSTARPLFEPRE